MDLILPDAVVNSYDSGAAVEEIREDYPGLTLSWIRRLIEFARALWEQPVSRRSCSTGIRLTLVSRNFAVRQTPWTGPRVTLSG